MAFLIDALYLPLTLITINNNKNFTIQPIVLSEIGLESEYDSEFFIFFK